MAVDRNVLDKAVQANIDMRVKWVQQAYEVKARVEPFLTPIVALLRVASPAYTIQFFCDVLEIHFPVTNMKEVEPMLESLQDIIGHEFNKSIDDTEHSSTRTFQMTKFPLKLICSISQDETANCKAVKVGEKIVPVYEFKCGNEAKTTPSAPSLPDDVPF